MHQVTHGHSWSGQERNVCYLNKGDGTFANTSFVSGLDHQDDGRAIGLVDWDRDGDLDVWLRNRTAPRLRLMRNDQAQVASWISFTLEGVQCNRDAIGAVVQASHTLTKSLRAGEFFMSQGSKSIHFGLGQNPSIEPIRVLWPGGDWETFPNVKPNQRYHLRQGTGKATPQNALESPVVPTAPLEPVTFGSQATIILPVKLPLFPSFRYRDQALQLKTLQPSTKGRLVVLWSSTCLTCQKELQKLSLDLDQYTQAGIKVLTLATDPLESSADSYTLMDKLAWPLPWGFVDQTTLAKFEKWHQTLFDRAPTLTVPLTLVLDAENKVLALHRGPLANPVDVTALANLTAAERHAASPPFAGRWFTNPVPQPMSTRTLLVNLKPTLPMTRSSISSTPPWRPHQRNEPAYIPNSPPSTNSSQRPMLNPSASTRLRSRSRKPSHSHPTQPSSITITASFSPNSAN